MQDLVGVTFFCPHTHADKIYKLLNRSDAGKDARVILNVGVTAYGPLCMTVLP